MKRRESLTILTIVWVCWQHTAHTGADNRSRENTENGHTAMALRRANAGPSGRNLPSMWLPTTFRTHKASHTQPLNAKGWKGTFQTLRSHVQNATENWLIWAHAARTLMTVRGTRGNTGFFVNTRGWKMKCHRTGFFLYRAYSFNLFCGETCRF